MSFSFHIDKERNFYFDKLVNVTTSIYYFDGKKVLLLKVS